MRFIWQNGGSFHHIEQEHTVFNQLGFDLD